MRKQRIRAVFERSSVKNWTSYPETRRLVHDLLERIVFELAVFFAEGFENGVGDLAGVWTRNVGGDNQECDAAWVFQVDGCQRAVACDLDGPFGRVIETNSVVLVDSAGHGLSPSKRGREAFAASSLPWARSRPTIVLLSDETGTNRIHGSIGRILLPMPAAVWCGTVQSARLGRSPANLVN